MLLHLASTFFSHPELITINTAITYLYFDFVASRGQSARGMLGCLGKEVVQGMERVKEKISPAFPEQILAIGEWEPELPDIVRVLEVITSSLLKFILASLAIRGIYF